MRLRLPTHGKSIGRIDFKATRLPHNVGKKIRPLNKYASHMQTAGIVECVGFLLSRVVRLAHTNTKKVSIRQ